jgi:hypothetical protein
MFKFFKYAFLYRKRKNNYYDRSLQGRRRNSTGNSNSDFICDRCGDRFSDDYYDDYR